MKIKELFENVVGGAIGAGAVAAVASPLMAREAHKPMKVKKKKRKVTSPNILHSLIMRNKMER